MLLSVPPRRRGPGQQHDEWAERRHYLGLEVLAKSHSVTRTETEAGKVGSAQSLVDTGQTRFQRVALPSTSNTISQGPHRVAPVGTLTEFALGSWPSKAGRSRRAPRLNLRTTRLRDSVEMGGFGPSNRTHGDAGAEFAVWAVAAPPSPAETDPRMRQEIQGKGQLRRVTTRVVDLQPETCCSATIFEWVAGGSNPEPTD